MLKTPVILRSSGNRQGKAVLAFEGFICSLLSWFIANQLGLLDLLPFLRGFSVAAILVAGLGALIGLTRALPLLRVWVCILFCFWLLVAYTPLSAWLVQPLKIAQPPETADAIVVLQAGIQADNDFVTPTLERTLHGLELIQQGFAPRLILTEDWPSQGSHFKAASALMKNLHIHSQVMSVSPVHSTHDEALLVSRLAKEHGWKKILLVTSPTHSRRALLTFRKMGLRVLSTPCQETSFDFENLSHESPEARLRAFAAALREIIGLRTYRARGWA